MHRGRGRHRKANSQVHCSRRGESGPACYVDYRPIGPVSYSLPGSLEYFLTERYCLYATDTRGALQRAEIHHAQWPLQAAEAEIDLTTISAIEVAGPPLCHFSRRQDVVIWPLEPVR